MRPRVLVCIDWFDPAFKAGGPIRSVVNMVEWQQDELDLWIFTSAYDLHSMDPLNVTQLNTWIPYSKKAQVFYATSDHLNFKTIKDIIRTLKPEQIYLNGMFSMKFVLYPLWLLRWKHLSIPTVLVPRGMLKESALAFKRNKKIIFLKFSKWLGLYKNVKFQVTDQQELEDVRAMFPKNSVELKQNFPSKIVPSDLVLEKYPGVLSIIFVGRIHPIKNLHYLLDSLRTVTGSVSLTVCGVAEDKDYLRSCQDAATTLPATINVNFVRELEHAALLDLMATHHALALPTQGENFGHAIYEMIALGRPVLISDQTPWRNLHEKKMGFDLPLERPDLFAQAIQTMIDWEQKDWDAYREACITGIQSMLSQSQ